MQKTEIRDGILLLVHVSTHRAEKTLAPRFLFRPRGLIEVLDETLAEEHGRCSDGGVFVGEGVGEEFVVELAKSFERPERVQPAEWRLALKRRRQWCDGRGITALDQETLGGVASPTV